MSDSEKPRILVVDDDTDGLEVLETRLVHAGYDVETATDVWVAARVNTLKPGLILMDLNIGQDNTGAAAVAALKRSRVGRDIPVLLYSSAEPRALAQKARDCGADGYLSKDGDPETLRAKIAEALNEHKRKALG